MPEARGACGVGVPGARPSARVIALAGRVLELRVELGDQVVRGQIVAIVEPGPTATR